MTEKETREALVARIAEEISADCEQNMHLAHGLCIATGAAAIALDKFMREADGAERTRDERVAYLHGYAAEVVGEFARRINLILILAGYSHNPECWEKLCDHVLMGARAYGIAPDPETSSPEALRETVGLVAMYAQLFPPPTDDDEASQIIH